MILFHCVILCIVTYCASYKILAIFPYNGRSHHIYFSSLVEELVYREHDVTVVNYHPMKKLPRLRQIMLQNNENTSDSVNIEDHMKFVANDLLMAYDSAKAFQYIANTNCKKLIMNSQIQDIMRSTPRYDVVIVEQFVTDCGLAIAFKLNAPVVGMTAHILMPWTYSRLGVSNNPTFVPNHFIGTGTAPDFLSRIKSAIINVGMNVYYKLVIQYNDQIIVNEIYPEIPSLEDLGRNLSLIMLNQYFPLTGARLYGPNVVEVGGLHIKHHAKEGDKKLAAFLDSSITDVVYISFGTVAANFPRNFIKEIKKFIDKNNHLRFIWKTDITDWTPPSNAFLGKWIPQVIVLCHPKVVAFVTHSGMLSTSEAMHCGVPVVGVPLFGDQYANAMSAVESGLGVALDIATLDHQVLDGALKTVLQDKYQKRAKTLSQLWKDRPLSPMDTAVYWLEYVAKYKEAVNLKPPTVDLPFYSYFMLDLISFFGISLMIVLYSFIKVVVFCVSFFIKKSSNKKVRNKKKD